MATIPNSHADILKKRAFAHLCTLMRDGSPQASPVWVDTDGEHVIVNSAEGRVKDQNMRRDPRVAVSITDPDNPYRSMMIRGRVAKITEQDAAAHIDAMAKKYLDVDKYPYAAPGEVRVLYYIEPEHVAVWG
ncbi:MAG: PPOX class F420-dependent oxidoreductase [Myxococcales bacterium]|nr:PPOX class F420-dependent oxidoreductase [Myxococcales bacterium]